MQPDWIDSYLFLFLLLLFIYVLAVNNITTLHKVYLAFHSLMMIWPFSHFFMHIVPDQKFQWLFLNTAFAGLCFLGFGWLIFALVLTKKIDEIKRFTLYLSAIPSVLSAVLVTTNPWHFLFTRPSDYGWTVRTYGPLFWVFAISGLFYLILSTSLMQRTVKLLSDGNMKKQLSLCIRGILLLLLFSVFDVLLNVIVYPYTKVIVPGLTSLGIAISAICFVITIHKYDLFRIINAAQREVIDSIATGMIVLDRDEIVLDINASATKFIKIQTGQIFDIRTLIDLSEDKLKETFMKEYDTGKTKTLHTEIKQREGQIRHVSINVSPVTDDKSKFLGRIITFNDITEIHSLLDKIRYNNLILLDQNKELLRVQEELYNANQKLKQMAITDDLTNCYNRRYMLGHMTDEISVAFRYKIPFSIMILDIDEFKLINDTHGHLVGDDVLRGVVSAVKKNLRRSDIMFRFGGEEFIIYAPHTDRPGASSLAEKIRVTVENHSTRISQYYLNVTISIGLISFNDWSVEACPLEKILEDLLTRADKALYRAKAKGRNCVVSAD
ncbi:MAG: diguanylate cyclase [Desulfotomaculaceae bacterium]